MDRKSLYPSRDRMTDEMWRILIAVDEGRMTVNRHGRYEIDYEERPDRKSREKLRSRGLIAHFYSQAHKLHWRVTAKGQKALREAGFGVRNLHNDDCGAVVSEKGS